MKLSRLVPTTLLLLLIGLVAGCGKSGDSLAPVTSGSGSQVDDAAVQRQLGLHPELVDDNGLSTSSAQVSTGTAPARMASVTDRQPLFFWRTIRSIDRTFEITYADTDSTGRPTTAHVTVIRHLRGTFNVAMGDSADGDSVVHKPLVDRSVRHLLLKRVHRPNADPERCEGWRIAASSGLEVVSKDATTNLMSVRVQAGALDTTITNPLALFRLRQIMTLPGGADVTLTATTAAHDDVVLLYTDFVRLRFHANGDGTYTGTWQARLFDGFRHFRVNALSHGSLFDPAAPYNSEAWSLPYRVSPADPGDYIE
jgi:hypothetical protein